MDALFSGCECFLAKSRAWREVSRHHDMPPDATATERAYAALADTFLMLLAQLPAIVHKAYVLREANRRGTVPLGDKAGIDLADVALLVRRAARLRARFIEFGRRLTRILPFPAEVPASSVTADDDGPEERPLFDTVLSYRIVWDGALYMGYWASVVVLNTCLQECGFTTISAEGELELEEGVLLKRGDKQPPDETTAETAPQVAPGAADDISVSSPTKTSPLHHPSSPPADVAIASSAPRPAAAAAAPVDLTVQTRRMVQDILRSVDGVCQGAMGPYRIGYPLRIAYEVASVEEKEWVRARLGRISEFYAAMSPSTFPPVEPPRQFRV